jgi:hypothetical protein
MYKMPIAMQCVTKNSTCDSCNCPRTAEIERMGSTRCACAADIIMVLRSNTKLQNHCKTFAILLQIICTQCTRFEHYRSAFFQIVGIITNILIFKIHLDDQAISNLFAIHTNSSTSGHPIWYLNTKSLQYTHSFRKCSHEGLLKCYPRLEDNCLGSFQVAYIGLHVLTSLQDYSVCMINQYPIVHLLHQHIIYSYILVIEVEY